MEDESRAPRGDVGSPSDTAAVSAGSHAASDPTAATATAAAEDTGHMQHQQQHDDGAGAGEPRPFANTSDEDSPFTAAANKTTTPPTDSAGHATSEHKEPVSPTDLAASPRSGAPGFVAPSSYLRPLAATRDREDHYKSGKQPYMASEPGAKRVMHPLDREQREGLVSYVLLSFVDNLGHAIYGQCWHTQKHWLIECTARDQSLSQGPNDL